MCLTLISCESIDTHLQVVNFFFLLFFKPISLVTPSECQTVWTQIRPDLIGPDLGLKCLQRLSVDDASSRVHRVKGDQR